MYEQLDIFSFGKQKFQVDMPIRLIELFAGIGSQAMALRDLGVNFEHYRVVEFENMQSKVITQFTEQILSLWILRK